MAQSMSVSVRNFNSIKVRLERELSEEAKILLKFQFHKGTIRTIVIEPSSTAPYSFQFHKGTIRTNTAFVFLYVPALNFNSIKVRLELRTFAPIDERTPISIP